MIAVEKTIHRPLEKYANNLHIKLFLMVTVVNQKINYNKMRKYWNADFMVSTL